jgi:predicted site-specific integrase-resolvase
MLRCRTVTFCQAVGKVVTEAGPALNGHRKKFLRLLSDPNVATVVVEHRDRFARVGAG